MKSKKTNTDKPLINPKIVIAVSAIIFIAILGISLFFVIDDASRSVTVRFLVAPSSASITLNGKEYQNATDYKITPGNYTLVIAKDGFESYEEQISPQDNDTLNISVSLDVLPGNEDYYKNHPGEAYALETIWTDQMISGSEVVMDSNPLLKVLPITVEYYIQSKQYVHYQISFRIDNPDNVTILVNDYSGGNYEAALERIRTEGYNPDDYTIEYHDLTAEYTCTDKF